VIELVDIAGLRPKEAATALGLPPGTVRMRLMRTRARLRTQARPPGGTAATAHHNHEPDQG
jgi:DNA-directed RNA polymerase specialized sigma24 family protein